MITDCKFEPKYILDAKTPKMSPLKGIYKRSFAFKTINERLPIILTRIIDNFAKDRDILIEKYGEEAHIEAKQIIGELSKLKYELQTDKTFEFFINQEPDKDVWNRWLVELVDNNNTYYKAIWLHAECYLYRRIRACVENSNLLKDYDYFRNQKEKSLTSCSQNLEDTLKSVSVYLRIGDDQWSNLKFLLKMSLWGNRGDLSISSGQDLFINQLINIDENNKYILVNQLDNIVNALKVRAENRIIDFVLDNTGFELFSDLVLANFIIANKIAIKVRFHVKTIPWFISDVTADDFKWTIDYLCEHEAPIIQELGKNCRKHLADKCFELMDPNDFWTTAHPFSKMKQVRPDLYEELSKSELIIFKGDLNYRKLVGDINWDPIEDISYCTNGFRPTNLCTLRTIKSDVICGMPNGLAERLNETEPSWMITGLYGVIQFVGK